MKSVNGKNKNKNKKRIQRLQKKSKNRIELLNQINEKNRDI